MSELAIIERELKNRICPTCFARLEDGACAAAFPCPVFLRLRQVIEVVGGIRDYSVEAYRERVRGMFCPSCRVAGPDGCSPSDRLACALDAYLPRIVAVIEKSLYAPSDPCECGI